MPDSPSPGLSRLLAAALLPASASVATAAAPVLSNALPAGEAIKLPLAAPLSVAVADSDSAQVTVKFHGRRVSSVDPADEFSVVALPDTQFYAQNTGGTRAAIFSAQTDWIVAEKDARNIGFVLHLGDITQNGDNPATTTEQWNNAANAMYRLENQETTASEDGIPYVMAVGNHDQTPIGDADGTTIGFNTKFGVHPETGVNHFAGKEYYGGTSERWKADNNYCLVSAGGMDFIVISLEYDTSPDDADLQWADDLLKKYPARRGIVITHHMVNTGNPAAFSTLGSAIYQKLKGNPNLILMHGGHVAGEGRRSDTFEGRTVHSLLADYQGRANGGDGWLRIMKFRPLLNRIDVETYSPTLDRFETDEDSRFSLDVNLRGGIGPFTEIGGGTAAPGNFTATWTGLEPGTRYEWYATASDGQTTVTLPVRSFITGGVQFPPQVRIEAPANGSVASSPADITLRATASDLDGTVAKVSYYLGTTLIGEVTNAPYQFIWRGVPTGSHTVIAKAADNDGQVGASLPISVQVLTEPAAPKAGTVSTGLFGPGWSVEAGSPSPMGFTTPGTNIGDISLRVAGTRVPFKAGIVMASNWESPANGALTSGDNIAAPYQDASGYAWINNYDNSNDNAADSNPATTEESAGTAAAFLPYANGWTGASVAADGSLIASSLPQGVSVAQADTGLYRITGLSTAGNLLAFVNGNSGTGPDNVISVRSAGGIWTIDVRDNSGDSQDGEFSFVYVPPGTPGVMSGRVSATGAVTPLNGPLDRMGATAQRTADYLEIVFGDGTRLNPSNSALFLTGDTSSSLTGADNIHSWSAEGNRFRIFSQDLPQLNWGFQSVDLRFLLVPFEAFDDTPPVVTITPADGQGGESGADRSVAYTFSRTGSTSQPLEVQYLTGGTATPGVDTPPLSGTVVIPAGKASVELAIEVLEDDQVEGDETLEVHLVKGTGYELGAAKSAGAILKDRPLQAFLHLWGLDYELMDADGDGQANGLEFFMGSRPGDARDVGVLTVGRGAEGAFVVRFPRAKAAVDVTGAVEWSTDLINWFRADDSDGERRARVATRIVSAAQDDPEMIEAVLTFSGGTQPDRIFARLAVTL